jgi:hypothetical protein
MTDSNGTNGLYLKAFLTLLSTAVVALFVWVWTAQSTLTEQSMKIDILTTAIIQEPHPQGVGIAH